MKQLIETLNNSINNDKDSLARYWDDYTCTEDLDVLFEVYKEISPNLPTSYAYLLDDMLLDRERYSVLKGVTYIENMMEEDGAEKPSELHRTLKLKVWQVLKSGFGGFTIDW